MSNVIGKVKYEDLNTIWNVYLPAPQEIEDTCKNYMESLVKSRYMKEVADYQSKSIFKKWLATEPQMTISEESMLASGIKYFYTHDSKYSSHEDYDYYKDMYLAAQNIRKVLKLKRMAPLCMNNIYADEFSLFALKDVVDNLNYYENLLVNYKLDFQD